MPGQRGISARRSRGSWALRIAGTVLAIATAATVASVLVVTQGTARARRQSAPSLPRHVLSTVAIGLLNPGPPPRRDSRPVPGQLYLSATGLAFAPSGRPSQASAAGEWTAARMSGGTYILIYVPDGRCLTAPSSPAAQGARLSRSGPRTDAGPRGRRLRGWPAPGPASAEDRWQGLAVRRANLVKRNAEQAGGHQAGAAGHADHGSGHPVLGAQLGEARHRAGQHGHHGARG